MIPPALTAVFLQCTQTSSPLRSLEIFPVDEQTLYSIFEDRHPKEFMWSDLHAYLQETSQPGSASKLLAQGSTIFRDTCYMCEPSLGQN